MMLNVFYLMEQSKQTEPIIVNRHKREVWMRNVKAQCFSYQ